MEIAHPTVGTRWRHATLHLARAGEMRARTAVLGKTIRCEPNGVQEAVKLIELALHER